MLHHANAQLADAKGMVLEAVKAGAFDGKVGQGPRPSRS